MALHQLSRGVHKKLIQHRKGTEFSWAAKCGPGPLIGRRQRQMSRRQRALWEADRTSAEDFLSEEHRREITRQRRNVHRRKSMLRPPRRERPSRTPPDVYTSLETHVHTFIRAPLTTAL
ncbi:hypothetical protein Q1695_003183 [Nippostrongylus brasiliensis]|nr:hypothetical protein Q1695_003183 [Nippostrongylus brasiliensis]